MLVFKGSEARGDKKDVLFIDASSEFEKDKNQNKLTQENIEKIVETYKKREDVDKYAHVASLAEIEENDFNLNIPRYVDTFEEEEVVPLNEIVKNINETKVEIEKTTNELYGLLDELVGTTPEADKELQEFLTKFKQ